MHISQHADQRMNQRGISRRLVDFTLRHGRIDGDKHILGRNESRRLIEELTEQLRLAKRIQDKGGVTVVEGDDTLITAYNVSTPPRYRQGHGQGNGQGHGHGQGRQGRHARSGGPSHV